MNFLITGGCGFIGSALTRCLIAGGDHRVRILDNLSVGREEFLALPEATRMITKVDGPLPALKRGTVDIVVGDIRDKSIVESAMDGTEAVIHLAANTGVQPSILDPRADCVTNVIGTLNVLEAAKHVGTARVVMASSGAPLGDATPPFNEETVARPISPYGASKLAGEGYCSAYYKSFGLETVALRFSNVYGPGSGHKGSVVASFMKCAIQKKPFLIYGDGQQTRDFLFLGDLLEAVTCAATKPGIGGELIQVASGVETTIIDLATKLKGILESIGWEHVKIKHEPSRVGDVRRNYAEIGRAHRVLGWAPGTALQEGLQRTAQWFDHARR